MSIFGAFFQRRTDERRTRDRSAVIDAIGVARLTWIDSIKSQSLDTNDLRSLAFVNNVEADVEDLTQRLSKYVRAYPEDAPMKFLSLFFLSYLRLVSRARRPSGDPIADLKANAKVALISLQLIAKYPACVEEAFTLVSGSATIPNHLTLRLDLAAPTPQERAWAATGIYDRFWGHFCGALESPVNAGGAASLKSYLVKSGLADD